MKPRRVIITIEAETDLPLADLRSVQVVELADRNGSMDLLMRYPADDLGPQPNRIVQVQVGTIKPVSKADMLPSEQERRDARAKLAKKFSDEVSKWPAKKMRACFAQPDTVAAAEDRERKAKRAKGAK